MTNNNEELPKKLIHSTGSVPVKLVTHDGTFHADDIFACATLCLFLEKNNETFEIIRTRDPKIIQGGDYVFDVGGIYDKNANRFDHHQVGGAGRRVESSGEGHTPIEYAAFGIVWEKFGKMLTNEKVAKIIDKRLAAPIDAFDNGLDLVENLYEVTPYYIQHLFFSMRPSWREGEGDASNDVMFLKCVEIAKLVLTREIIQTEDALLAEELVLSVYDNAPDKRIIVLDKDYPYGYVLNDFSEPLYVVYPRSSDKFWGVRAVRNDPKSFQNRKNLPKSWAGLRDEDLQMVSGVRDAVFCHRGVFLAVAKSKEGAIKLAQIAVES